MNPSIEQAAGEAGSDALGALLRVALNDDGTLQGPAVQSALGGSLPAVAATDSGKYVTTLEVPGTTYGVKQLLTVSLYHSVSSLASFQADLDAIQEWNYTTITPDDLYDYLTGNRDALPDKPLLITFDDGLLSQYSTAYPELLSRGMTATFYVIPNWMDDVITGASFAASEANHFTWANAQTMFANGMRIQCHTMNHISLVTMTDAQVVADFASAKARIEAMVPGETVNHIAYPYGLCAATAQAALAAAGVKTGRTVTDNYSVPSSGRLGFVSPFTPRLAVPTAGVSAFDYAQANFYRRLNADPELIPDFGFKSGAGKGWSLATGSSIDGTTLRPGAAAGTKSLKQVQQTSAVSSSLSRVIPVGMYCHLRGNVWVKTSSLGSSGRALLYLILMKPDAVTTYQTVTTYLGTVPDNQDWTEYTFDYYGDTNVMYVRLGLQVNGTASPVGTAWFAEPSLHHYTNPTNLFPAKAG